MLRLVRLTYPNSIRADLFTEFAMQTSHDSIKYAMPVYTDKSQWGGDLSSKFDMPKPYDDDIMYESTESRYATEMVNATEVTGDGEEGSADKFVTIKFANGEEGTTAFGVNGENYIDGASEIFLEDKGGRRIAVAVQVEGGKLGVPGDEPQWLINKNGVEVAPGVVLHVSKITATDNHTFKVEFLKADGGFPGVDFKKKVTAVGRYNSNTDLSGQYLGEINITMKDYQFRPRPLAIGVTWTQQTELILDTSYGISAEELLMDTASNEIKKTLDYQAVKYADKIQRTNGLATVVFKAEPGGEGAIKDSYWHTAQNIGQAIGAVKAKIYNKLGRGGVSAIVGGMSAVNYLMLSQAWTDKGAQDAFGGYKAGEINGIPVFVVPDGIVADNELITTWKNPTNETDVSIAIGILYPFFSTGTIQRKQLYKEGAIARYEDTQALNPLYLGRIKIDGIRELATV